MGALTALRQRIAYKAWSCLFRNWFEPPPSASGTSYFDRPLSLLHRPV